MKFEILKADLLNTGGGVMVLYTEILLPSEGRTVYGASSEELAAIWATEEERDETWPENVIAELWFDEEKSNTPYCELLSALLELYEAKTEE